MADHVPLYAFYFHIDINRSLASTIHSISHALSAESLAEGVTKSITRWMQFQVSHPTNSLDNYPAMRKEIN